MPFQILHTDILSIPCDAIINPTDELLSGSGGLDAQIHAAAGEEFEESCRAAGRLAVGAAVLTRAYRPRSPFVIQTVAPWYTGGAEAIEQLRACYRSALRIVAGECFRRVAFPLIGSGTRGFPREIVLAVAAEELCRFLAEYEEVEIILAVRDRGEFQPNPALLEGLEDYRRRLRMREEDLFSVHAIFHDREDKDEGKARKAFSEASPPPQAAKAQTPPPLGVFRPGRAAVLDESFSQMVLRKIDEKGFEKDSDCYSRANIDRRLFSKLRSDAGYHPKKTTAVALAIALELSLSETDELLMKAGYSLSHSILFDVIVEYCITQKNYNIFEINELLFQYDQPLLGG